VFLLKHELLHCVLLHCTRGKGYDHQLYNIAADIVVNSNILKTMGVTEYELLGEKVMHRAPDGKEGYLYTAEQVYKMLLEEPQEEDTIDNHDIWNCITAGEYLEKEWEKSTQAEAGRFAESGNVPPGVREFLDHLGYESQMDWKAVLRNFIHLIKSEYDYLFSQPDRRLTDQEFILPSFCECEGEGIENIWFVADTSGSIDNERLCIIYEEVKSCVRQFDRFSGKLSFFDTKVHGITEFENVEDLKSVRPIGGGGTSFRCIFEYMKETMIHNLPTGVIILTDGFARYPEETQALGVPVLWVIVGENNEAPWGETVHIL